MPPSFPAFTVGPRVTTSDGVGIATYDLGGDGPPLLLCHATGFHGLVWLPVARRLAGRYHCVSFDARGHGHSGKAPGDHYDWDGFARDVLAVVDGLGLERPRGVGHSCGGAMVLLAEEARPGTFRSMYCFEPVVSPRSADAPPGRADAMAAGTRRRREVFPSLDAAMANYRAKAPFAAFDPAALAAYVEYGFEDLGPAGVRLRCRRDDEARVYQMSLHHRAYQRLNQVACPVTLACGAVAPHFGPDVIGEVARRLPWGTAEVLAGVGHFGPMEQPWEVAGSMLEAFGSMDAGAPDAAGAAPDGGLRDPVRIRVTPSRYPELR